MTKPTTGRAAEQAQPADPLAVDIAEACNLTSLSRSRLYGEIRDGRLTPRKIGRRTVIAMTELRRWLSALPTS
jgi:excisionase family DNA binding protein